MCAVVAACRTAGADGDFAGQFLPPDGARLRMRSLLRALGFMSILPLGRAAHFDQKDIPSVLAAFPLAGAVLGALLGLLWHGLQIAFPNLPAGAVLVAGW